MSLKEKVVNFIKTMSRNKEEKQKKIISPEAEEQLKECLKKKDEYLAGWQRERADFLNYKKDELTRIESLLQQNREELILKILFVLDNFEIAEKNIGPDFKQNEHIKGFLQIKQQLKEFLKSEKVEEIETEQKMFDPALHEAISQEEKEENESGMIIAEIQKGYTINGRLLRPARVKVVK